MVTIRAARPEDAEAIAAVRAQSWRAAYQGIIPADILAGATGAQSVAAHGERIRRDRWTSMILAETGQDSPAVVGFASFGPERASGQLGSVPGPGQDQDAELYAIYVLPGHWSAGAGRALMDAVLERAADDGYGGISLWVLTDNLRARRFYERAGFGVTSDTAVLADLGGVTEVRYERALG